MSEKYPTCCECGSAEIDIDEEASGDRRWRYSAGRERVLDCENIDQTDIVGAECRHCDHEMEPDDIVWKEFQPVAKPKPRVRMARPTSDGKPREGEQ